MDVLTSLHGVGNALEVITIEDLEVKVKFGLGGVVQSGGRSTFSELGMRSTDGGVGRQSQSACLVRDIFVR